MFRGGPARTAAASAASLRALVGRRAVFWISSALIALGLAARLRQYLSGRALWLDEALLWSNLARRSSTELLGTLDLKQAAPVPFLLAEDAATELLGDGELALRLLPLVVGIAALPLSYVVAQRFLRSREVPFAVAGVALSYAAIYYSSEAKQYSIDILVALAILLLALWLDRSPLTSRRALIGGVAGAGALWLSDPAVFMLAGVGVTLIVSTAESRDRRATALLAATVGAWLMSFGLLYVFRVLNLRELQELASGGEVRAAPDLAGVLRPLAAQVVDPRGALPPWMTLVACLLVIAGSVAMLRDREFVPLSLLVTPIGFQTVAYMLGQYPIGHRFGLFLTPAFVILIAAGAGLAWRGVGNWLGPVTLVAAVALTAGLVWRTVEVLVSPIEVQEMDVVLDRVAADRQPTEEIYVTQAAQYAFAYYAPRAGLDVVPLDPSSLGARASRARYWNGNFAPVIRSGGGVIAGRWSPDVPGPITDDLAGREGRVWVVFIRPSDTELDRREFELASERLEVVGQVRTTHRAAGAAAVLLELPDVRSSLMETVGSTPRPVPRSGV